MPGPAHILAPSGGWGIIVWLPVVVAFAGVVAWVLGDGTIRRVGVLTAVAGLAGAVVLRVVAPSSPPRPAYSLDVVSPRSGTSVTSPVGVVVCGRQPDGSAAEVPGANRVLSVALDGSQVESVSGSSLVVDASSGPHDLVVDVLTSDHRAFDPPLEATVHVVVTGPGPIAALPRCPS